MHATGFQKNKDKKDFIMRILKQEEIMQAILNNTLVITPTFAPWHLHNNSYALHPYCMIAKGTDGRHSIQPMTTGLLAGTEYRIVTTENIWTPHPRLKLGVSFPDSLVKKAMYGKIDMFNANAALSLVFTPRYNFTLNAEHHVAKIYFLFDDDTNRAKENSTENAILQKLQIISPICVAQNTKEKHKKVR